MRFKSFIAVAVSVLVVLFVLWGIGRLVLLQRAEETVAQASLVKDTVEAARDTSRALPLIGVLGDSLRAAQRRAVQVEQRADELDAALKIERVARARLAASVGALRATVKSDTVFVERSDGERRASFDFRQAPYTVHADVALRQPPDPGRIDVQVGLDTLGLEVRVGCGSEHPQAVRPAIVTVVGPPWASVQIGRVEQAPSVCSPAAVTTASGRWTGFWHFVERFGVSVGYSATRSANGTVVAGPGLVAGFRVWP